MHFGWEKYELFQDTAPAKVMAALVLLKLNGQASDDQHLRELAAEVLGVEVEATCNDMCGNYLISEMVSAFRAKRSDIDKNEEVWLMRAMDPLILPSIDLWIANAKKAGVSSDRIKSAEAQRDRIARWQLNHGTKKEP